MAAGHWNANLPAVFIGIVNCLSHPGESPSLIISFDE